MSTDTAPDTGLQQAPALDPEIVNKLKLVWKALPRLNYYQLLEISPKADQGEVKKAFYKLSRDYHPDRYFRFPHENFRNAVHQIYKRIAEAYNILRSPQWREAYDRQIAEDPAKVRFSIEEEIKRQQQGGTTYDGGNGPGKRYWMAAMDALKNKNVAGAKLQLQLAVGIEPANEQFKAKLEELKAAK